VAADTGEGVLGRDVVEAPRHGEHDQCRGQRCGPAAPVKRPDRQKNHRYHQHDGEDHGGEDDRQVGVCVLARIAGSDSKHQRRGEQQRIQELGHGAGGFPILVEGSGFHGPNGPMPASWSCCRLTDISGSSQCSMNP